MSQLIFGPQPRMSSNPIDLRSIQLYLDLQVVAGKLNKEAAESARQAAEPYLRRVITVLNALKRETPAPEMKKQLLTVREDVRTLLSQAVTFSDKVLQPAGVYEILGAYGEGLAELVRANPRLLPRDADFYLKSLGASGALFDELFAMRADAGQFGRHSYFHSPLQVEADYKTAISTVDKQLLTLEEHNTDWWAIAMGIAQVVGGIIENVADTLVVVTSAGSAIVVAAISYADAQDENSRGRDSIDDGLSG